MLVGFVIIHVHLDYSIYSKRDLHDFVPFQEKYSFPMNKSIDKHSKSLALNNNRS